MYFSVDESIKEEEDETINECEQRDKTNSSNDKASPLGSSSSLKIPDA